MKKFVIIARLFKSEESKTAADLASVGITAASTTTNLVNSKIYCYH